MFVGIQATTSVGNWFSGTGDQQQQLSNQKQRENQQQNEAFSREHTDAEVQRDRQPFSEPEDTDQDVCQSLLSEQGSLSYLEMQAVAVFCICT